MNSLCVIVRVLLVLPPLLAVLGCSNATSTDSSEIAQQVGDAVASIDEAGGNGGSFSGTIGVREMDALDSALARVEGRTSWWARVAAWGLPMAQAAACSSATTFGSCSNNTIVRTFGGCSIRSATFNGTVTLAFDDDATDNTCRLFVADDTVTRSPSFTVTGRRGATLSVSKSGTIGQRVTKTTTGYSFTSDGIRRTFTSATGTTILDFTTETTSAITITGSSRADRVLTGGTIKVLDHLKDNYCTFVPNEVTWETGCNCPISGSFSGTCSTGKSVELTFSGCGSGSFTLGSVTESVDLDRCYSTSG